MSKKLIAERDRWQNDELKYYKEIPTRDEQLPPTPKRPSTVRFNVEEARIIENALASYSFDGRIQDPLDKIAAHNLSVRLRKFIAKYSKEEK